MAEKDTANQTFTFDTVAVLVAVILENGGNLGGKEFKRMSALDGTRGEHGFNHMFRKVKERAKQLNEEAKAKGELTPVSKSKAAGGAGGAKKKAEGAGTGGKKRARKPKKGEEAGGSDGEDDEPASKKVKPEPKEDSDADAPGEDEEF